ncbi:alpha/beta hydrolase [Bacillus salipaludis]|uniref:Alpha/beta hydrolase n=1 Tax=Bacillus salipaludis TaxID=2547811 RepID=A0ABW8RBS6_9BACI
MMKTSFVYKEVDGCEIRGDFYSVETSLAPLVVYIHGGGLIWGMRGDIKKEQIALYQQAGYHVCSIDYRLAPESKLPSIIEDVQDVLIWLKEQGADRFHFDPERIAVTGSSAGGYLALLAGTFQVRPKAIVSFYGYGDILGDWYQMPSPYFSKMTAVPEALAHQLIQQKTISEAPIERRFAIYLFCRQKGKWIDYVTNADSAKTLIEYCPVESIDAHYPPTMLLHGDMDEDVPFEQSLQMSEALTKAGIYNKLITIPNGIHSFDNDMDAPVVINAFNQVIKFLKETL